MGAFATAEVVERALHSATTPDQPPRPESQAEQLARKRPPAGEEGAAKAVEAVLDSMVTEAAARGDRLLREKGARGDEAADGARSTVALPTPTSPFLAGAGEQTRPPPPGELVDISRTTRGERVRELLDKARRGERMLQQDSVERVEDVARTPDNLCKAASATSVCAGAFNRARTPSSSDAERCKTHEATGEAAARDSGKRLRQRMRHWRRHAEYQRRMERLLPSELMAVSTKSRQQYFDKEIEQTLLRQPQFEKQLVSELMQVRNTRAVIKGNREMANELMQELLRAVADAAASAAGSAIANAEKRVLKERTLRFLQWLLDEQTKSRRQQELQLCAEVADAVVELAVWTSEYQAATEGPVPQRVKDEWSTMLLANYPLMDMTNQEEVISQLERLEKLKKVTVFGEDEDSMFASTTLCTNLVMESALDKVAVRDYLDQRGRWDPERCPQSIDWPSECGLNVIGHMVHRLLDIRYMAAGEPDVVNLPPRTVAAAVIGVHDPRAVKALRRLLEPLGVLLVTPEEAIVHCIQRYQQERFPDSEENFDLNYEMSPGEREKNPKSPKRKGKKEKAEGKAGKGKDKKKDKKEKADKDAKPDKRDKSQTKQDDDGQTRNDKAVQVPETAAEAEALRKAGVVERVLRPTMTTRGRLGHVLLEHMLSGHALTPDMVADAVLKYIEALVDGGPPWRGWVLLDMPRTQQHMAQLEQHLTGRPVPPAPPDEWANHPLRPFTPFAFDEELESQKEMVEYLRQSHIFPNPTPPEVPHEFEPYLNMLITTRRQHRKFIKQNAHARTEECPPGASFTEKLYASAGVAYSFYYRCFDVATVRHLARILINNLGEFDYDVEEKWLEILADLEKELGPSSHSCPSDLKKRILPEGFVFSHLRRYSQEPEGIVKGLLTAVTAAAIGGPVAGEFGWRYGDLDLHAMGDVLAKAWEAAEGEYLRGLAEVLTLLRGHSTSAPPFMERARAAVRRLIHLPEPKQLLVDTFQMELGEMTPEMRQDPEVKAEWHLRADELRDKLLDICKRHRDDAEAARQSLASDIWIAIELAFVANLMVMLVQLELNFFSSALQVIQDYYLTMFERPLRSEILPRYTLSRLELSHLVQNQIKKEETGSKGSKETIRSQSRSSTQGSALQVAPAAAAAATASTSASPRRSTATGTDTSRASSRVSRMRPPEAESALTKQLPSAGIIDTTAKLVASALLKPPPETPPSTEARDGSGGSLEESMGNEERDSAGRDSDSRRRAPTVEGVAKPSMASPAGSTRQSNRSSRQSVATSVAASVLEALVAAAPDAAGPGLSTPLHAFVSEAVGVAATRMEALAQAAADVFKTNTATASKQRHSKQTKKEEKKEKEKEKEKDKDKEKEKDKEKKDEADRRSTAQTRAGSVATRKSRASRADSRSPAHSLPGAASAKDAAADADPDKAAGEPGIPDSERAAREWISAVRTLHLRAKARLKLLECRTSLEFKDFLTDMFKLFQGLYEEIHDRYDREVAAVNMLTDVLQLMIEDEEAVTSQFVLEGDALFARPDVLMAQAPPVTDLPIASPDNLEFNMTVSQLLDLTVRLQSLAPAGLMAERALLEQLVELSSVCAGDGDSRPLPLPWNALGPQGLQALVERTFGKAEVVDWRDLIVRSLEPTYPSVVQILQMRERYWRFDPNRTELVPNGAFLTVPLWFSSIEEEGEEDSSEAFRNLMLVLFKAQDDTTNYTAMLLHFCKAEKAVEGLCKALSLATGCRVVKDDEDELQMRQEALAPLGRRVASFEAEARDAALCAVERMVGDTVRKVESPYLAWLPDEHRAAVWKALLGDEPCPTPAPAPTPANSRNGSDADADADDHTTVNEDDDPTQFIHEMFGGFFKSPKITGVKKTPTKPSPSEYRGRESPVSTHNYDEQSEENRKDPNRKAADDEDAVSFVKTVIDDSFAHALQEASEEEEDTSQNIMEDEDAIYRKMPWMTQLPFDLVLSVLSASLPGLVQSPPPLILGPKSESYPQFRGIVDLLLYIYSELGEGERSRWSVSSKALLSHPLLLDLLSFTTNQFTAFSMEGMVKEILDEYGLEALKTYM